MWVYQSVIGIEKKNARYFWLREMLLKIRGQKFVRWPKM